MNHQLINFAKYCYRFAVSLTCVYRSCTLYRYILVVIMNAFAKTYKNSLMNKVLNKIRNCTYHYITDIK